MGIYHSLPNPVSPKLNSYRKTLTSLYDLVELPNHIGFPSRLRTLLSIILIGLSLAASEIWGFKVSRAQSADPRSENAKLHIRPRSVGQSFTLGSEVVRCVSGAVIVRIVRRSTLFVRRSTLFVGKCLDVRRTLRIHVFSSRRRTFNVSFLRLIRKSDFLRGKTFCAERRAQ